MARSIAELRIHPISVPLERAFWMSLEPFTVSAGIVVEIETDDGLVGIGEIHGRPQGEIAGILESAFKPLLIGEDPSATSGSGTRGVNFELLEFKDRAGTAVPAGSTRRAARTSASSPMTSTPSTSA